MFEFVHYRYPLLVTVFVIVILDRTVCINAIYTPRRGGVDIFNLLLGLYKLNPLKASKVYSKFAKNVLTPGDLANVFSSNENTSNKRSFKELKEIENVIHPLFKKQSRHSLEKPEYDVENVDTEKFDIDVILRDDFEPDYVNSEKLYSAKNILERYGIVKSNENVLPNITPNTKLLPVNQWLLPTSIHHKPMTMRNPDSEYKPNGDVNRFRLPNDFQDPPMISDNVLTADVVVI